MSTDKVEVRARLRAQRDAETDPAKRELYDLAHRAGFDGDDAESAAQRVALHAAGEIVLLRTALIRLRSQALDASGVIHEYVVMPVRSLSDKFPTTVARLNRKIAEAHDAIVKTEGTL